MSKVNKNSAKEDDVGRTHSLVTKLANLRLEDMLEKIESGDLDASIAINMRDVQIAAKWVEYNEIGSLTADKDENSELKKNLDKIRDSQKGNVIQFLAEEA